MSFVTSYEATRNCCICLDNINTTSNNSTVLGCGHNLHPHCLERLFLLKENQKISFKDAVNCSVCKRKVEVVYNNNPSICKPTRINISSCHELTLHTKIEQKTQSILVFCCLNGNIDLLKNTLANNENILKTYSSDKSTENLIDIARENGYTNIVNLLNEYNYQMLVEQSPQEICLMPEILDYLPGTLEADFLCKKYIVHIKDIIISLFKKSTILSHAEYIPYESSSVDGEDLLSAKFFMQFAIFHTEKKKFQDIIYSFADINTRGGISFCINNLISEFRGYLCIHAIARKYNNVLSGDIMMNLNTFKDNSYLKNYMILCDTSEEFDTLKRDGDDYLNIAVRFLDFFDARSKVVDWDNLKEQIGELRMQMFFASQEQDKTKNYASVEYPTGKEDLSEFIV